MKVYALIWHYIESDGLSGVFLTREEAESHLAEAAGTGGNATIHEMEIGRFYEDAEFPKNLLD